MRPHPTLRNLLLPRISLAVLCAATVSACLLVAYGAAIANPVFIFLGENYLGRSPKNLAVEPTFQYTYSGVIYQPPGGEPWANYPPEDIELRIVAPCSNPVVLHPDGPSGPDGVVTWGAAALNQGGGSCAGPGVVQVWMTDFEQVFELGEVRSPDQDGDGFVALGDLVPWQLAFVNQQPAYVGDLDRDGVIGLSDLLFWQRHFVAE